MDRTVGAVARTSGVSVRTLHHYDAIGLLSPSERSASGYRIYSDGDLERLQQVLFFRELGFGLDEVGRIMNDPAFDRREALLLQRRMLTDKAAQLGRMVEAVDAAIHAHEEGTTMSENDMFDVFGEFDPAQYEDEVRERWGQTDAYKESARRTKRYTAADWLRFRDESQQIGDAAVALMDDGVSPDDPRAMAVAERAHLQIDTWFYPCSHEMHANLAEMYIADPRFTATYEKMREGMAQWWHDAIVANGSRSGT